MTKSDRVGTLELVVVPAVIAIQGLTLSDGTMLVVEVDNPQQIFAVIKREAGEITVVSIHVNQAEADARALREAGAADTLQ